MSTSFTPLIAATLAFLAGHFVLSALPIRGALIRILGRTGFLVVYSTLAMATFIWMNVAYARAPFDDLWGDPGWARWVAVLIMPVASTLFAGGVLTANPGAVGFEKLMDSARAAQGIQKVTRHPILWAVALWAGVHLLANGDMASVIFFGGLLVLCLLGMIHLEARKAAELGESWQRFAAQSSFVPFAGIVSGRLSVGMKEIGWNRLAAGVILYLVLLFGHRVAIDVPLLPQLAG
jgi:uncharacterized membrane protein